MKELIGEPMIHELITSLPEIINETYTKTKEIQDFIKEVLVETSESCQNVELIPDNLNISNETMNIIHYRNEGNFLFLVL